MADGADAGERERSENHERPIGQRQGRMEAGHVGQVAEEEGDQTEIKRTVRKQAKIANRTQHQSADEPGAGCVTRGPPQNAEDDESCRSCGLRDHLEPPIADPDRPQKARHSGGHD